MNGILSIILVTGFVRPELTVATYHAPAKVATMRNDANFASHMSLGLRSFVATSIDETEK